MSLNSFLIILIIKILFFNIVENKSETDGLNTFVANAINRLLLADDVALYKFVNHKSIDDKDRENELLTNMTSEGKKLGLKKKYVKLIFQDQIHANKQLQKYYIDSWNKDGRPNKTVPDLKNDIRPKIDTINNNMLISLVNIQKISKSNNCSSDVDKAIINLTMDSNQSDEQIDALNVAVCHLCKNPTCKTS
ncbi:hypothetical protein ACQ4LE_009993 [Meloidogyne hapla]